MNKSLLYLLLLIFLYSPTLAIAETLRWGYLNFPPFNYEDKNGIARGSLVDIVNSVSSKAHISIGAYQYPNRRAYQMIDDGRINFAVIPKSLIVNQQHHLISQFPVAHLTLNVYWIGNKSPINKISELQGASVILITALQYGNGREYLENKANNISIAINVENHRRAFEALLLGRADYMLGYAGPTRMVLNSKSIENLQSSQVSKHKVYFVLAKETKDAANIMQSLEHAYVDIYGRPQLD